MTPLAPLITGFLRDYMPRQRGYSPQTCETYALSFKLLFAFAAERARIRPSPDDLASWLRDAVDGELASFTSGLQSDGAAVRAAIVEPWSNGQTEGQITKLKLVKRRSVQDLAVGRAAFPTNGRGSSELKISSMHS